MFGDESHGRNCRVGEFLPAPYKSGGEAPLINIDQYEPDSPSYSGASLVNEFAVLRAKIVGRCA